MDMKLFSKDSYYICRDCVSLIGGALSLVVICGIIIIGVERYRDNFTPNVVSPIVHENPIEGENPIQKNKETKSL